MAVSSFIYPVARVTQRIQQEYIAPLLDSDPVMKLFPIRERDTAELRIVQKDSPFGVQHFRGLGGEPQRVQRLADNVQVYKPGVYGEYMEIGEEELTEKGKLADPETPVDVGEDVADMDQELIARGVQRIKANCWGALQGNLNLFKPGPNDTIVQQTYAYNVRAYSPQVPLNQLSTATPIANFQQIQQYGVGTSSDFGAGATAYLNTVTANTILNNANQNDFAGRKGQFGQTLNDVVGANQYWQMQNLPKLVVNDDGYYATRTAAITLGSGVFTKYIPDGVIIVVGQRPGNVPVGEYTMTRCIPRRAGDGGYGMYRYVVDTSVGLNGPVTNPPKLQVHRGHNGAASLFYQRSVIVAKMF